MRPNVPGRIVRRALDDRPIAFLVSTTTSARAARDHLGAPAYSYGFVLDALKPVLERLGTCQVVDRPESRLAYAAARAVEDGYRPVHLALAPLQDIYHTPALPTIVYPFWEFPRVPDRDFGLDTRQNWARMCRPAGLVLTACRFTAEAFRRAPLQCPVAVVPVPFDPALLDVPSWDRAHSWTFTCRHVVLGGEPRLPANEAGTAVGEPPAGLEPGPGRAVKGRLWAIARRAYHRAYPWLDPRTHERIARVKRALRSAARHSPPKLVFLAVRWMYKRAVRPWLSDHAIQRVTAAKERLLRMAGHAPTVPIDPLVPAGSLTIDGLVYTTLFNIGDLRKNFHDIITAFLIAFRDRPDVTLVIKLATNPSREHHEVGLLQGHLAALGIRHRCRVVIIAEYLDDDRMRALLRATTFYVNASHAEGACLPLQQALAAGRPAIAPDHTAMADYMDDSVGFVIRSHPEPTHWPHDPERRIETERLRPLWSDLHDHYLASAALAEHDPAGYARMADAARQRIREVAGFEVAVGALRHALSLLTEAPADGALDWPAPVDLAVRAAS